MPSLDTHRLTAVPSTWVPNSIYFVTEADNTHAAIYVVGNTASDVRRLWTGPDIDAKIATAVSRLSALEIVADIAARDALSITANQLILVADATGDSTVASGAALYAGQTVNGTTTFTKVSEFESMDVTLQWGNIQGKPTSVVADIDDAVGKRHAHANATELAKIGQDQNGDMTWNGALPKTGWATVQW